MAMYSIFNNLNRNDLAELSLAQLFFQRSLSLLPMFIDVAIVKHLDVLYLYWFRYLEHRLFFVLRQKLSISATFASCGVYRCRRQMQ